jgi:two-component system, NtrC family, nitrogen regulation sensor histidine kinase NtrY
VKNRLIYGFLMVALVLGLLAMFWPFNPGPVHPATVSQIPIFWAVLSLIFLLIVILSWILLRESLRLYEERQSDRVGSHIKTKLVVGAVALSVLPVCFLVAFNYGVINRNLATWFRAPASNDLQTLTDAADLLLKEMGDETQAQAELLAAEPETRQLLLGEVVRPTFLQEFCRRNELSSAAIFPLNQKIPLAYWGPYAATSTDARTVKAHFPVVEGGQNIGSIAITALIPLNVAQKVLIIQNSWKEWNQLHDDWKYLRTSYTLLMALITVFILFVAVWIALFLAKQISVPITALLGAASEVRKGNLQHRVEVRADDELGDLVRAFNRMIEELDTTSRELDRRRRFTEAILESIPTGVISISADGSIKRVNRALSQIFPPEQAARATHLEDLFSREDTAEIKYLMKRARRTGAAARQLELRTQDRNLHLAVTVSALEEKLTSGFVVVLEDTSELLRAQKSAAWHEVARRVAHEIKNPLTPIALSAERIARQLDRVDLPPATARIVSECTATIAKSVESVKTLVDAFAQFARFPAARPMRSDLNEVVRDAIAIFHGRLDGISIRTEFDDSLPPVNLDREQFQRVVVNLIDNAAEAMQDSLVKELYIATQHGGEIVELVVADSGPGVSSDDKEKLFLPYFSTKNRGTGLGLAIVSHIVTEHNGHIRVETNHPSGARFIVEIPAIGEAEAAPLLQPAEPAALPA